MEKVKDFLISKGFNKNQIEKITQSYIFQTYKNYDTLLHRIQTAYKWFEDQKYDKAAIIHMVNDSPSILVLENSTLEDKINFFEKSNFKDDEIKKITKGCSEVFSLSVADKLSKVMEFLDKLYKDDFEAIKHIVLLYPKIFSLSIDSIKDSLKAMKDFGLNNTQLLFVYKRAPSAFRNKNYILKRINGIRDTKIQLDEENEIKMNFTKNELKTIISRFPRALTDSVELLNQKLTSLYNLGFDANMVKKMVLMSPPLLSLSKQRYAKQLENFESFGYSKEDALKLLGHMPTLFNLTKGKIKDRLDNMEKYGYPRETCRNMTVSHSSLLNLTKRLLNSKLKALEKLGFSKDEIIYITSIAPNLITSSTEMTKDKIEYLREIGLGELLKRKPTILVTGVSTVYARYEFFKHHEPPIEISEKHHSYLFIDWKRFEKRFGITKKELLKQYSFEEYKEKHKKER